MALDPNLRCLVWVFGLFPSPCSGRAESLDRNHRLMCEATESPCSLKDEAGAETGGWRLRLE